VGVFAVEFQYICTISGSVGCPVISRFADILYNGIISVFTEIFTSRCTEPYARYLFVIRYIAGEPTSG
jgi:hypothetical protein